MRLNQPVTDSEYRLDPGQNLVSITDPKGLIVYCNPAFIAASGFSYDDLLGQPHNVVRHPDMPEEAFRDLWTTLHTGRPWRALVKNRRKNGDFYWVLANVTPVHRDRRIVGYLSVRTAPSREAIQQAEALYACMRDEAAAGRLRMVLHGGQVIDRRVGSRIRHGALTALRWMGVDGALMLAILCFGTGLGLVIPIPLAGAVCAALWMAGHATVRRLQQNAWQRVIEDLCQLAAGDLTHEVTQGSTGQLGLAQLALAQLVVNLRTVIGDVSTSATDLRGAIGEIATGNQDLSSRTEAQSSSLEQTAASMEQINGTVQQTAETAAQGAARSAETAAAADRAQQSMDSLAQSMQGIAASSARIGEIIAVIEGVAFQTNILALNAAVEAARAGEKGRGFAVVATEVRSLAQRTTAAAREIKQLIDESAARVGDGTRQTAEAQARVQEVQQSVTQLSVLLEEVNNATQEQKLGVSQVSEAVTHMDGITQQNAAMVEQLAASAKALNAHVDEVAKTINLFVLRPDQLHLAETDAAHLRRQARHASPKAGDEAGFDLAGAVQLHLAWKTTLRNAADRGEQLDTDSLCRDDRCGLGQWIHGEGRRQWGRSPRFTDLLEKHARFHAEAGRVAQVVNRGARDEARRLLTGGTAFAQATQATVMAMRALAAEVKAPRAKPQPPASPETRERETVRSSPAWADADDWTSF